MFLKSIRNGLVQLAPSLSSRAAVTEKGNMYWPHKKHGLLETIPFDGLVVDCVGLSAHC